MGTQRMMDEHPSCMTEQRAFSLCDRHGRVPGVYDLHGRAPNGYDRHGRAFSLCDRRRASSLYDRREWALSLCVDIDGLPVVTIDMDEYTVYAIGINGHSTYVIDIDGLPADMIDTDERTVYMIDMDGHPGHPYDREQRALILYDRLSARQLFAGFLAEFRHGKYRLVLMNMSHITAIVGMWLLA